MGLVKNIYSLLLTSILATGCGGGVGLNVNGPAILHVDDSTGPTQEYSTIQAAVNAARPADTVLVHDGNYRGFTVYDSGKISSPIMITAQGNAAVINRPNGNGEGITLSNSN